MKTELTLEEFLLWELEQEEDEINAHVISSKEQSDGIFKDSSSRSHPEDLLQIERQCLRESEALCPYQEPQPKDL